MFRPEMGTRLPNTLMLGAFLRRSIRLSADDWTRAGSEAEREKLREAIRARVVSQFDRLAEKFRDGHDYTLLSEAQTDRAALSAALMAMGFAAPDGSPEPVSLVSRRGLIEAEHAGPEGRRQMEDLLDLADERSLRRWLDMRHVAALGDVRYGDRDLANVVNLSLGSQRLLAALDTGFGYPFAHVFKDDITAFWTCYVAHAVAGDTAAMERMEPFAAVMRQSFPVVRLACGDRDPISGAVATSTRWIFMID